MLKKKKKERETHVHCTPTTRWLRGARQGVPPVLTEPIVQFWIPATLAVGTHGSPFKKEDMTKPPAAVMGPEPIRQVHGPSLALLANSGGRLGKPSWRDTEDTPSAVKLSRVAAAPVFPAMMPTLKFVGEFFFSALAKHLSVGDGV